MFEHRAPDVVLDRQILVVLGHMNGRPAQSREDRIGDGQVVRIQDLNTAEMLLRKRALVDEGFRQIRIQPGLHAAQHVEF